jgi:hypothetical protein
MKSLKRVRKTGGRCYELAGKIMLNEPGAERFTLVHGRLDRPWSDGNSYHAWIDLNDGRVFCTTWNKYAPADEYAGRWGAVADRRYARVEAVKLMLASGHFGPWE